MICVIKTVFDGKNVRILQNRFFRNNAKKPGKALEIQDKLDVTENLKSILKFAKCDAGVTIQEYHARHSPQKNLQFGGENDENNI